DETIEVRAGDVLIVRANGVADLVAITVYVETTPLRLMLSDKILRPVPQPGKLTGDCLARLMMARSTRRQVGGFLNGSSGQKNISQAQICSLVVSVPLPCEQVLGSRRIQEIERRIRTEESGCRKLRTMRVGLVGDLLTGRIRVTPLLKK